MREESATSRPIVEVDNLTKTYRRRRTRGEAAANGVVRAVDGVSFAVERGGISGLLGPNGAGKTTTIKTICGLIRPDGGRVLVGGVDVARERQRVLRSISAVLEGNRNLYWRMTALENLVYFAGNRGVPPRLSTPRARELLGRFGLADKANEVVNNLSRGMQQKLAIAVALLADTDVILLDEPTLGLDVEAGHEVRALLRDIAAQGKTVIISTHDMPVVQDLCERVVIINQGRVVTDDRVENLLRLFSTLAYSVKVTEPLPYDEERRLRAGNSALAVSEDRHEFTVTLAESSELHALMGLLAEARLPIASFDRVAVDFEQVFRALVNGREHPQPTREEREHVFLA